MWRGFVWSWALFFLGGVAFAANDVLVWGQMERTGFAFVGKPEAIRDQCLAFTTARRIRSVDSIIVRGERIHFGRLTYAPQACEFLVARSVDLGSPQKHKTVTGDVRRYPFTFTGLTSTIVLRCTKFLVENKIPSTASLRTNGEEFVFKQDVRGHEICGEIAFRGRELSAPFAQSYAAGSVDRNGFVFVGYKELFIEQCLQFARRNQIVRATSYEIDEDAYTFPHPVAPAPLCETLYARSTLVKDSQARFSANGHVRGNYFWFVGTVNAFLLGCSQWMDENFQGRLYALEVQDVPLKFAHALYAVGTCGLILREAKPISAEPEVSMAVGVLGSRGFAFAGTDEGFDASCRRYLDLHRVRESSAFRIQNREVKVSPAVSGGALCRAIRAEATVLAPPYPTYSVSGDLAGFGFWFRGRSSEVIWQCQRFLDLRASHVFGEIRIGGKLIRLEQGRIGSEVCGDVLTNAAVEAEASLAFVGGAIGRVGFSFSNAKDTVIRECVDFFQKNGVGAVVEARIFDRVTPMVGLAGAPLCEAIFRQGAEYREWPEILAEGSVGGRAFRFAGKLDAANRSCREFVQTNQVGDVSEIQLADSVIKAPVDSWQREEICSVILRKVLH